MLFSPSHLGHYHPLFPPASFRRISYITTQGIHPTQQSNPPQSQSTHLTVPGCLQPGFVREDVMEVVEATLVVEGGISALFGRAE